MGRRTCLGVHEGTQSGRVLGGTRCRKGVSRGQGCRFGTKSYAAQTLAYTTVEITNNTRNTKRQKKSLFLKEKIMKMEVFMC